MTNHPLTDEIISKQFGFYDEISDRKAYDEDDMRAATDWQLDCDAAFWCIFLIRYLGFTQEDATKIVESFKKAVRPQEEA